MKTLLILALLTFSACGKPMNNPAAPAQAKAFGSSWYYVQSPSTGFKVFDFTNANHGSVGLMDASGNVCLENITLSGDPTTTGNFVITPSGSNGVNCQVTINGNFLVNQTNTQLTICTYNPSTPGAQSCGNFY